MVDTLEDVGPLTFDDDTTSTGHDKDGVQAAPDVEIPEKFKGKSLEDVVKSYQELEQAHGRQSHEVGELRRMADTVLKERSKPKVTSDDEDTLDATSVDIYEDPNKFVAAEVEKSLKPIKQHLEQVERENVTRRLEEAHPDFRDVTADPGFLDWVNQDAYRIRQYDEANTGHDFYAANNLLSTFKAVQAIKLEADRVKKEEQLKDASMTTGTTGQTSKKIYNRAALIALQNSDPARYASLQDEIMLAYREGRVR